MHPIEIEHLQKNYDHVQAVKGVSFHVDQGEIFGLIGPDGAGKTTILRILVSLLMPDAGRVRFQGRSVAEHMTYVRSRIGYMPQRFSLYQDLSVEENLRFFGDLFQVPQKRQAQRMERLYHFSNLGPFGKRRAGALSGGMKQKLALSCMLMHEPGVVVLDEPTYGVDPVSRSEFWNILKQLKEEGTAVLVTTAYMDEAELCDRVGLIFEGEILALDKPDRLLQSFEHTVYLIESDRSQQLFQQLQETPYRRQCNIFGNGVHLTDMNNDGSKTIENFLKEQECSYQSVKAIRPDLEDLFLMLMQYGGRTEDELHDGENRE